MDLGIGLPICGDQTSSEIIARFAQEAERLGYTALWTSERLLYPYADVTFPNGFVGPLPDSYRSVYEPIETLAYVASLTRTIKLGTSIVNAPFQNPLVLARRFATLDRLSQGRAIAGLGQGWVEDEFLATNATHQSQGSGMDEYIAIMRETWKPNPVSFKGNTYHIPLSQIDPKPVQQGGVPIVMGGVKPAAIERAARIADGYNPMALSFDILASACRTYRSAVEATGRDVSKLQLIVRSVAPIRISPLPEKDRPFLGGSAEQVAQDLEKTQDLGVDHVFFDDQGNSRWDDMLEFFERLQSLVRA